jgi:septal ring factor EnvC (AmiA/AmiB activator)
VILVSHDARLIDLATEIWVCDGPPKMKEGEVRSGCPGGEVRLEKLGFKQYRLERLKLIAREAARIEAQARARVARKREARRKLAQERVQKASPRKKPPAPPV